MNTVVLMGRITRDLELRMTPNGVAVLQFSIAVDRKYQKQGEERQADFFNCVAWRNTAEFINRYFGKGRMIGIVGHLQSRMYQDKNGENRYITEVIVDEASFTGEKKADAPANGATPTTNGYSQPQATNYPRQNNAPQNAAQPYYNAPAQNGGDSDSDPFYVDGVPW